MAVCTDAVHVGGMANELLQHALGHLGGDRDEGVAQLVGRRFADAVMLAVFTPALAVYHLSDISENASECMLTQAPAKVRSFTS